jgi:hypothetical protein
VIFTDINEVIAVLLKKGRRFFEVKSECEIENHVKLKQNNRVFIA